MSSEKRSQTYTEKNEKPASKRDQKEQKIVYLLYLDMHEYFKREAQYLRLDSEWIRLPKLAMN